MNFWHSSQITALLPSTASTCMFYRRVWPLAFANICFSTWQQIKSHFTYTIQTLHSRYSQVFSRDLLRDHQLPAPLIKRLHSRKQLTKAVKASLIMSDRVCLCKSLKTSWATGCLDSMCAEKVARHQVLRLHTTILVILFVLTLLASRRVLQKYYSEKSGLQRKTLWGVLQSAWSPFNYSEKTRISQFKTSIVVKSVVKTDHKGKKNNFPTRALEIGKSRRRFLGKNHLCGIIEWKKPCCYTCGKFFLQLEYFIYLKLEIKRGHRS